MHYTSTIKRWGIIAGLIFGLAQAGQGQLIKSGTRAAFNTAQIVREMAVTPAVEKTFMRNFPAFVPADISTPVTKTALTKTVAAYVPFHVENKLLNLHVKQSPYLLPVRQQLRGVFLARPAAWREQQNSFSGTIFKTQEGEIFGVIASHAIADHVGDPSLQRLFTADVYVNGRFVPVQAEVVQVSAPEGLDLALVKFQSRTERYFQPFELSEKEPQVGDIFQTIGFAGQFAIYLPGRSLLSKNTLYLRAGIDLGLSQRRGLCGAALLDKEGRLIGLHTGSTYGGVGEPNNIGYATGSKFINTLVEAYYNGGRATVPFVLNGQKIIDLDISEYVSYVKLVDAHGRVVEERAVRSKFSYREVEQMIRETHPRYMDFKTSAINWDGNYLRKKSGYVNYRYDLRTRQTYTYTEK